LPRSRNDEDDVDNVSKAVPAPEVAATGCCLLLRLLPAFVEGFLEALLV